MTTNQQRSALSALALAIAGCAVKPPPDPRALDCEALDRAAERFPEECAESDSDAGGANDDAALSADGGLPEHRP